MEVVHRRDREPAALRPCPSWCTCSRHFAEGHVADADDGFHHLGSEAAVPASESRPDDMAQAVVKVMLKSWTCPVDAAPGPARIEFQLGTPDATTGTCPHIPP